MKFINFAVVKFAVFLTLGILAAYYFSVSYLMLPYLPVILILLFIIWKIEKKQLKKSFVFGLLTYLFFFGVGFSGYQVTLPQFQKNHYSHRIPEKTKPGNILLSLKITEILKPDRYNNKYLAECISVSNKKTKGKLLVNIQKDSLTKQHTIDDILLVSTKIVKIQKPLNPHQFDYAAYMKKLGVYNQVRISRNAILKVKKGEYTLRGIAESIRQHLISKLKKSSITKDEQSIIQALVLGQRRDIDKTLYANYAAAGAVHILAVSGLHVGILFFILKWLFYPLRSIKRGKLVEGILIILCLFCFALLAGLSPSVVRAATMFSLFLFAEQIQKPTNSINTLFLSYLLLLLINPLWLFQVGFQLSYLAVLFILLIQPKLFGYWYPKNWFLRKFWAIVTVTIAAQLGVIPLSLYYFHQFPGLFILTNVVVLPFLGILLGAGILIVLLSAIDLLPEWLSFLYNKFVSTLNSFINWVAKQDAFLFQDIHFSEIKVISLYLIIVSLVVLLKRFSPKRLQVALVAVCLLLSAYIYDKYKASSNELIVFHKSRTTAIGIKQKTTLMILRNDSLLNLDTYPFKGYRTEMQIDSFSEREIPSVFSYNNKSILILDSLGIVPKNKIIDIVILTNSPRVNLERLIKTVRPSQIIADGNNYKSYVKRWSQTCEKKKLPFYYTGNKGAFILE